METWLCMCVYVYESTVEKMTGKTLTHGRSDIKRRFRGNDSSQWVKAKCDALAEDAAVTRAFFSLSSLRKLHPLLPCFPHAHTLKYCTYTHPISFYKNTQGQSTLLIGSVVNWLWRNGTFCSAIFAALCRHDPPHLQLPPFCKQVNEI